MNYMKQIATDILGLYWDDEKNESEEFRIKGFDYKYKITPNSIHSYNWESHLDYGRIAQLLMGELEIERIPWKPKKGEIYYLINETGNIDYYNNNHDILDACLIKCGWAFRTKEEAEANKERVFKEMWEVLDE